jgi:hypothetical protein
MLALLRSKLFLPKRIMKIPLKKKTLRNRKMLRKIRINWSSVLKVVEESSTKKHLRSMLKPANWFSCQKENSLTPKPKD